MTLGDSEGSFVPYDEDLDPLATQEEAAAYEANMALEAERELEFQRRFTGEVDVGTWCTCLNCSVTLATKGEESICCKEIDRVDETKAGNSYRTIFSQGLKS